jgi:hypothetical protein
MATHGLPDEKVAELKTAFDKMDADKNVSQRVYD